MTLYLDFAGLQYKVTADIDEGCVEYVSKVEILANTGKYFPVKVENDEFLETMQDYLNEAIEEALLDERLEHGDMLFEQRREEGKL